MTANIWQSNTSKPFDFELARYKTMYDTLPMGTSDDASGRPRSLRSFASSGKRALIKEFIHDQFERFRYKMSQNQFDTDEVPPEMFSDMSIKAEYEEPPKPKKKSNYKYHSSSNWIYRNREPRCVMLVALPKDMNLASVVSQVRGGQLERISVGTHPEPFIEFRFLNKDAADAFFKYAGSGLFVILGTRPKVRRLPYGSEIPGAVQPYVLQEVSKNRATRVVKLRKPGKIRDTPQKKKSKPYPGAFFAANFDVDGIRRDMAQFGQIIDIKPSITETCTVNIHYSALSESILAMRSFQLKGTALRAKYLGWTLEYDKDPADVPCYNV